MRPGTFGDRAPVAALLAAAFQNDPAMVFIYPDTEIRRARLPALFAILHDSDVARGVCLVTRGGEAATLWRAPGTAQGGWREKLAEAVPLLRALGPALGRALAYSAASDANHPAEPHWYLHIAGCAPQAQGRGHGRNVVRAGLDRADADGVPAYLETSTERNIGYYQSFGFTVTHDWRVRGSLQTWSMLRPVPAKAE